MRRTEHFVARVSTATGVAATIVYLSWRALFSMSGAKWWLAGPAFFVEVVVVRVDVHRGPHFAWQARLAGARFIVHQRSPSPSPGPRCRSGGLQRAESSRVLPPALGAPNGNR